MNIRDTKKTHKFTWDEIVRRMREAHPGENLEYPVQELTNGIHTKIRIIDHDLDEDGEEYGEYWQEINSHLKGQNIHIRLLNKKGNILPITYSCNISKISSKIPVFLRGRTIILWQIIVDGVKVLQEE